MLVDMRVRVDHSGQDELSRHVDALGRLSFGEVRLDGGDPPAPYSDVLAPVARGGRINDGSAGNHDIEGTLVHRSRPLFDNRSFRRRTEGIRLAIYPLAEKRAPWISWHDSYYTDDFSRRFFGHHDAWAP